jgi:peptide deformylase
MLRYYGDPILRQRAEEVGEITNEIREVVNDLEKIIETHRATGAAAPQGGHSWRVFVAYLDYFDESGQYLRGPKYVFINPKLSDPSAQTEVVEEGCLSIPGLRIPVERPVAITIEALDLEGNPFRLELRGHPARIVMHENDHLNGTLTVDRAPKKVRRQIEGALRMLRERYRREAA